MVDPADLLTNGPACAERMLVLAHGAGAPMDSGFMQHFAAAIAAHGIGVVRFEFPYMAQRRRGGARRPPDPPRVLEQCYRDVVAAVGSPERLCIGGKSLGGRIASQVADGLGVRGLVCLGYPFHPPGQAQRLRIAHLRELRTPALVVQGERDPFGTKEEVASWDLSPHLSFCWIADGDHSLVPRARSGRTTAQNLADAVNAVVAFVTV